MDDSLKALAVAQKRWSNTATALKDGISRARLAVMGLAVSAAIVETLAAQTSGLLALVLGYSGAACLGVLAIVRQQFLDASRLRAWVLSRAASESFKREMYLYRARAGQYASDSPEQRALDRLSSIVSKLDAAQAYVKPLDVSSVTLPGVLDMATYRTERADAQARWLRDKAEGFTRTRDIYASYRWYGHDRRGTIPSQLS